MSFRSPRIFLPFLIVTLIWGSTWIVIKDQIAVVPPGWSVAYRFLTAAATMFAVALITRTSLRLDRRGLIFTLLLGIAQFTFNFNFVYRAEHYITSGLVALVFALLFVPNAVFARIFIGHRLSGRFLVGSVIAIAGLGLLFLNEARGDSSSQSATLTGIGFTLLGVLSASTANVMQATQQARAMPMTAMIGWAMLFGGLLDAAFAWTVSGPPQIETRLGYLAGIAYLGIVASALAFSLYFRSIRDLGPARAAYSSVIIPAIAMALSTAFEGYRWTASGVLGAVVTLAGMVVALSRASPSTNDG